MGSTNSPLSISVEIAARNLSDIELAMLIQIMREDSDPRNFSFYGVVGHLFTEEREGIPIAHEAVKEAFARAVETRRK